MLMLNWPSWEERRKGGEGRIEDGRPSQAKNAIALVVGAGRPLCLDGTGSGDTQDEPRDHWHLLADRLVSRARREVLGPTGRCFPTPSFPGLGYLGAFSGHEPLVLQSPQCTLPPRCPAPHFWNPVLPLPGLTPGLFSLRPRGPLPAQQHRNSISSFHSHCPPPVPSSPGDEPLRIPASEAGGRRPSGGWGLTLRMGLCGPEASPRKWVLSCAQLYQHTTSFFPPFLESDLEGT